MKIDLTKEPLGIGSDGNPVYLKDIWPSNQEVAATIEKALTPEMFRRRYGNVSEGPAEWRTIDTAGGLTYPWDIDRKSAVKGKSMSVRVALGGRRNINKKRKFNTEADSH